MWPQLIVLLLLLRPSLEVSFQGGVRWLSTMLTHVDQPPCIHRYWGRMTD
jgi:hypothetical protein